jgi:hypothetical protein
MNHIYKNIYLGNSQDPKHTDELMTNDITFILNVAKDLDVNPLVGIYYKSGLMDGPGNTWDDYIRTCYLAYSLFLEGKNMLIHCHEGKSRSAFIVLILITLDLFKQGSNMNGKEVQLKAMDILVKARPIVTINKAHFDVYESLVASLFLRGDLN